MIYWLESKVFGDFFFDLHCMLTMCGWSSFKKITHVFFIQNILKISIYEIYLLILKECRSVFHGEVLKGRKLKMLYIRFRIQETETLKVADLKTRLRTQETETKML